MTRSPTQELLRVDDAPRVPGLRFRRFRDDGDYAAIAGLVTACNVADGIDDVPTAHDLRIDYETRGGSSTSPSADRGANGASRRR
jgi:hypothetical protein